MQKKLLNSIVKEQKIKRDILRNLKKLLNIGNTLTEEQKIDLKELNIKHEAKRTQINTMLEQFKSEKRTKEINLCEGNSRKAITKFWTHINKEKSTTIENIESLPDPITKQLHNNKNDIMKITENHLLKHFNASYAQKYKTNETNDNEHEYSTTKKENLKKMNIHMHPIHIKN